MNLKYIIPSTLILGGLSSFLYNYLALNKNVLIFYDSVGSGSAEFLRAAEIAGSMYNSRIIPIQSAQNILNGFSQNKKFSRVIFIGHGSSTIFGRSSSYGLISVRRTNLPMWLTVEDFARRIAPKLTKRVIISIAGCRVGANPYEANWSESSYGPGGQNGFAGKLRDSLSRLGFYGEIRAKAVAGHVLGNPIGRTFKLGSSMIGKPGKPLIDDVWGEGSSQNPILVDRWIDIARGNHMIDWTLGGSKPSIPRG
jgi:hypothetical protein